MADKPSRGLVLYGDGLARYINQSHTQLNSLASRASCAFLSLPNSPTQEIEDARIVREFAELLDAAEAYHATSGEDAAEIRHQKDVMPSISDRFMGMRSAMITNNPSLTSFGGKLGFKMLQWSDIIDNSNPNYESPPDVVTSEVLKLLGFQRGKASEKSPFDLVFIHIEEGGQKGTDNLNSLVGQIMRIEEQEHEISSRLHLSLVMSYGPVSEGDVLNYSVVYKNEKDSSLSLLFPRQSYTMKGTNLRDNVRHYCPMLTAQWQNAVTRKDLVETFSFADFKEHGGLLTIPADRFLHEIAFKLWKAPKYGA